MGQNVAHVVAARPNFIKAAAVMRALASRGIVQTLIHTGQHYDDRLSDVFFRDLDLPRPDLELAVGSGSHAVQTAAAMVLLEPALVASPPALLITYGDVNSTLAAVMIAAKLGIPVAHVEAGLRSFDDRMPEEVNRRVADLLSDLLFATSPEAVLNLRATGIPAERIHFVGNPMIDTLLANLARFDPDRMRASLDLPGPYVVATVHRPANVDDAAAASRIVSMLHGIARQVSLVIPLHPRGRRMLESVGLHDGPPIRVVEPLGYIDFMSLIRGAAFVVTDSGGVQEETTILGVPCLTVRPNTERPITISHGTNELIAPDAVAARTASILAGRRAGSVRRPPLWDGHAGQRIASVVDAWMTSRQIGSPEESRSSAVLLQTAEPRG